MSFWNKADIHVHTLASDGTAEPEAVVAHAARHTDLRVLAITDHDTIAGARAAQRHARAYGIDVIVGEEISTREGHLLALCIEEHIAPHQSAAATIAAVHAQGGLCIPAHPYDWLVRSMGAYGFAERCAGPEPEWPVNGVEVLNASVRFTRINTRAACTSAALGLAPCGGSDSHHLSTIGLGYTQFKGHSAADLCAAIRAHTVQAGGTLWHWSHVLGLGGQWVRRFARQAHQANH